MAITTNAAGRVRVGRFLVEYDPRPGEYDWRVTRDGECYETHHTRDDAVRAAAENERYLAADLDAE